MLAIPDNNGGYEVELDSDFFNENNPYWEQTWLSLPMIQALEYDSGEQTLSGAKLMAGTTEGDTEGYMYQPLEFDMGEFPSSVVSRISLSAIINPSVSNKYILMCGFGIGTETVIIRDGGVLVHFSVS